MAVNAQNHRDSEIIQCSLDEAKRNRGCRLRCIEATVFFQAAEVFLLAQSLVNNQPAAETEDIAARA